MRIKFSFLLLLSLALVSISCGDDDSSEMEGATQLVGTWKAESLTGSASTSIEIVGETTTTIATFNGKDLDYTVDFSSTSFMTEGSYAVDLEVTVMGQSSSSSDSYDNVMGSGTYTTSGDTIFVAGQFFDLELDSAPFTVSTGPTTARYTVVGDKLTVTQNETVVDNQFGIVSTSTTNSESVWTKQ